MDEATKAISEELAANANEIARTVEQACSNLSDETQQSLDGLSRLIRPLSPHNFLTATSMPFHIFFFSFLAL